MLVITNSSGGAMSLPRLVTSVDPRSESFQENYGQLQELINKIILKFSAQDILKDLQSFDLENDEQWQLSRSLSWEQEKHKYILKP